ncbi:MAG: cyanate transporter, partial [Burkholderiaceae bacterium]
MIRNRDNPAEQRAATALRASSKVVMAIAIMLVGMNLRPVITSVGPVLESIRVGLGMSPTSIGLLITLPILCFGAFAPLAPRLLRYRTIEQLILYGLLILAFGIGLRSFFGITGLFAGTLVAGASISVIMVFLPSLIKRDFSHQAGQIMGLYSTALCLGAAIAAGATVPLQNILGS